jgi:HD superfamily phosphohydrolase
VKVTRKSYRVKLPAKVIMIDPIHGCFSLSKASEKIISTQEFQRLREVHQLGFVHYVYETAEEHMRYQHCLGVAFLAKSTGEFHSKVHNLSQREIELLEIAGLIHDIGHGPFSHSFEVLQKKMGQKEKHEQRSCSILRKINQRLEILSLDETDFVCSLVSDEEFKGNERLQTIQKFCKNIISSGFDVDRLDYVYRDLYHLDRAKFVKFAEITPLNLIQTTTVKNDKLIVLPQFRSRFENMRETLYREFYYDKRVLELESMVLDCLFRSEAPVDPMWTDQDMMNAAESGENGDVLSEIVRGKQLNLLRRVESFYNRKQKISPMKWG